jgi:hypothetical protein
MPNVAKSARNAGTGVRIVRLGGGTRSAEMHVVSLEAGAISCKQCLIFSFAKRRTRLMLT